MIKILRWAEDYKILEAVITDANGADWSYNVDAERQLDIVYPEDEHRYPTSGYVVWGFEQAVWLLHDMGYLS